MLKKADRTFLGTRPRALAPSHPPLTTKLNQQKQKGKKVVSLIGKHLGDLRALHPGAACLPGA